MYVVYKHTNEINQKAYIGWTSLSIDERWHSHCYNAKNKSQYAFHRAILKYGTDGWKHQILEVHSSKEDAKLANN